MMNINGLWKKFYLIETFDNIYNIDFRPVLKTLQTCETSFADKPFPIGKLIIFE